VTAIINLEVPANSWRLFSSMYKFSIPEQDLKKLWLFRENLAVGSLASQVRQAVSDFIRKQEEKIGLPVEEAAEIIKRHDDEESERRHYQEQPDGLQEVATLDE